MEIPNYDIDGEAADKKFKQLHPFMPSDTFRMLICGNSGSGKTNLLYHMLMKPLLHYDEIYLYARNLEQDKYKRLIQKMRELSHKFGYEILNVSNDEITPVTEMDQADNQKLVIFDDYVCDKNQRQIIDYFIQGRHKNCSVIYLSQSFYKTPKDIRLNCSHYITVYTNFRHRGKPIEYHLKWELIKTHIKQQLENHFHFFMLINQRSALQKTLLPRYKSSK